MSTAKVHPSVGSQGAPSPPPWLRPDPATKLLVTVEGAAELLSVSRDYIYELIRTNAIRSVLLGQNRRRISVTELKAFVERTEAEQAGVQAGQAGAS